MTLRDTMPVTAAVALAAATLAYVLHHLPLPAHSPWPTLGAVVGAATIGLLPAVLAVRPRHPLPAVILARSEALAVREAATTDAGFCAALHAEQLPEGFFVSLGHRFLTAYHVGFQTSPHAFALVGTLDGRPVGFLAGVVRPREHLRWLLRNRGARLAMVAALAMVVHPGAGLRFVRTRLKRYVAGWRRHRAASGASAHDEPPVEGPAVLSHVAVMGDAQGLGLGERLVRAFEAEAAARGARRAILLTHAGEQGAGRFYERLGWRHVDTRTTADGATMGQWAKDLDASGR